ncbi:MAG: hypothetical protein NVS2B17_15580 [Candidatus Velthaea sp.]
MAQANLHGSYRVRVLRGSAVVTLTIIPSDVPGWQFVPPTALAAKVAEFLVFAIWSVTAAWLYSMRPSTLTLAFYFSSWSFGIADQFFVAQFPPSVRHPLIALMSAGFGNASNVMLVVFALRFPDDAVTGRRRLVERVVLALVAIGFSSDLFSGYLSSLRVSWLVLWLEGASTWAAIVSLTAAATVFVIGFAHTTGVSRARLRWAMVGISVPLVANVLEATIVAVHPQISALSPVLTLSYLALPPSVTYVLTRTRFVDPRFTLNRATAISVTGSALVLFIATADWVTSKFVSQRVATDTIDAAVAIGVAITLNAAHRRIERTIERVLFARKHRAEHRLRFIGSALRFATAEDVITQALVSDVARELQLASSAFFRFNASARVYERVRSIGWSDTDDTFIPENAQVVRFVKAERDAIDLHEWRLDGLIVPRDQAEPRLAVPVLQRDEVTAIVLYSSHSDHTDLDISEKQLLCDLAERSASALDHIEALELRIALAAIRGKITVPDPQFVAEHE